jgi:hypothetical protein
MKHWKIVLLSCMLGSVDVTACYCQASTDSTESIIQHIRKEYTRINSDSSRWRKESKDIMGASTEGGEMVLYYNGKDLEKVVTNFYGETGRAHDEYYFQQGKLLFAYEVTKYYDRPMSGKVVRTEADRYYFYNQKLIRWINPAGKIADRKLYPEKEGEVRKDLEDIERWRKNKGKVIEEE